MEDESRWDFAARPRWPAGSGAPNDHGITRRNDWSICAMCTYAEGVEVVFMPLLGRFLASPI